mmetsp:Transcript_25604/g.59459  ORF Transcript_25604/g.59459 Transcript_25604/m.59459 type:complete len:202 (+) Transcript_25604:96-701(+)
MGGEALLLELLQDFVVEQQTKPILKTITLHPGIVGPGNNQEQGPAKASRGRRTRVTCSRGQVLSVWSTFRIRRYPIQMCQRQKPKKARTIHHRCRPHYIRRHSRRHEKKCMTKDTTTTAEQLHLHQGFFAEEKTGVAMSHDLLVETPHSGEEKLPNHSAEQEVFRLQWVWLPQTHHLIQNLSNKATLKILLPWLLLPFDLL